MTLDQYFIKFAVASKTYETYETIKISELFFSKNDWYTDWVHLTNIPRNKEKYLWIHYGHQSPLVKIPLKKITHVTANRALTMGGVDFYQG